MGRHDNLTSTQRGKIAEVHVATALMACSGGRLSPFEPMSDDHGIDLIVLDKETGRALPIQVKSWLLDSSRELRTVQFDVQKSTFGEGKPGALICVVMDPDTLGILIAWLIPSAEIPSIATDRPTKYVLAPSRLEGSRDKYVPHRHSEITSLAEAVSRLMSADHSI